MVRRGVVTMCVCALSVVACSGSKDANDPLPAPHELELPWMHCGLRWLMIGDSAWRLVPVLDDGNGNPPDRWAGGGTGTVTYLDHNTARFDAPQGTVFLHRMDAIPEPEVCYQLALAGGLA